MLTRGRQYLLPRMIRTRAGAGLKCNARRQTWSPGQMSLLGQAFPLGSSVVSPHGKRSLPSLTTNAPLETIFCA